MIKTSSLGDIIQCFDALGFLRHKYPSAQIDWVCEAPFAELLNAHPLISHVLRVETKKWRKGENLKSFFEFKKNVQKTTYDAVFDFQGNIKSGLLTYLTKAKVKVGFDRTSVAEWPNILFTNQRVKVALNQNMRANYLSLCQNYCNDFSPFSAEEVTLNIDSHTVISTVLARCKAPYRILVHPASAWPNKEVGFNALVEFLKSIEKVTAVSFLFAFGNPREKEISSRLHVCFPHNSHLLEPLALPELQTLMRGVDLVIAMDSLPLHLCGTTKTPSLSFFGPSLAEKYIPQGPQHHFIQGSCPYKIKFDKRCPLLRTCKTGACIKTIYGEEMFEAFLSIDLLRKK